MFSNPTVEPAIALILSYLLGSIPFGLVLTRLFRAGDLRNIGSGNIGATNVLRTGHKGLAAATLILDALKGTVAVLIVGWASPGHEALAATGAFLGHLFPVWLRFRGGKGVATFLGILAPLLWPAAVIYACVWLGLLALARYSSVSGMSAAVSAPIAAALFGRVDLVILFIGFALLVLWKHRENIGRLMAGTESRVGSSGNG